jgi:hypothetical protein
MTNSVPGVIENLLKEDTDLSNISVINMAENLFRYMYSKILIMIILR